MPLWGSIDQANNSALPAVAGFNKVANTTTRDAFYANTTANAYITGVTVGQFGIDAAEATNSNNAGIAHAGWVVKKVGSGGRAGRITWETLVAMGSLTGDGDANTVPPETP